jgi:mono/diheme cytochrome c family protein
MATGRAVAHSCRLVAFWFLANSGAAQLVSQTPVGTSARSSKSAQASSPGHSSQPAFATPAARELFRQNCIKCHGLDGTGGAARGRLPRIPDFTKASWQARRTDAQLVASILDGKEPEMPSWRGKVSVEQARSLVAHVRAFAPTGGAPKDAPAASFDQRYSQLQGQMRQLQVQERKLHKGSSTDAPSQLTTPPGAEVARPPASEAVGRPDIRALFRQHCMKCHGTDGMGVAARERMPEIPDFTASTWQALRSDAQLLASILDGKDQMPRWRGKITEEQARSLVAHVRGFAPTRGPTKDSLRQTPAQRRAGRELSPAGPTPKAGSQTNPDD